MTSPDAALAARPEACSACGGPLDSLGHCAKCGAVFGEAYRCPLCQALSDVEPNAALYYRCRTCGGPRIPPTSSPLSEAEISQLRSARSEQLRASAFRAGSGFALASGVLSLSVTAVVLLATSPAPFAKLAAFFASLVPFALSFFAVRRAREHARQLDAALQQAWLLAASRVAAAEAGAGAAVNAATLAKLLRVDEARAELLLAEVSVQDFVRARPELPARLRVTELADPEELSADAPRAHAPTSADKP
ncbi:MAG TPA: hypothetical protein VHW01_12540 [Polyangiaceae bacterium]|nr:hypothetical protein [Polyangiaceae bacterium]